MAHSTDTLSLSIVHRSALYLQKRRKKKKILFFHILNAVRLLQAVGYDWIVFTAYSAKGIGAKLLP